MQRKYLTVNLTVDLSLKSRHLRLPLNLYLPGYLIHLTAELRLDGQIVANGGTFTMGDELVSNNALFDPARGWDFGEDNLPIAGEYIATHVDLQGVSIAQLQSLKDKLTATQAKLQAQQFAGLNKEDISGDILYSAVLSYFTSNQAASQIAQRAAGIVEYRRPSFGNFIASAKTIYWFGIPRNLSFPGLIMDINRYASIVVAKDNSSVVGYMLQSGMRESAYEHLIPEKLFTDPLDPNRPQGVSAVKALALAASQGQKIYTLNVANQANHATLLAQISIDSQAMADIQNGLAAGKEVTVHQAPITQSGWTGSGYIITDPATGSGAYKISGGVNGGVILFGAMVMILQILLVFVATSAAILFIGGLLALVAGGLLGLSLSDDPFALAEFAGARLLVAVSTIALLVVVEGFVLLPLAATIGVAIAIVAAFATLVNVLFKIFAIRNEMFLLPHNERTVSV